MGMKAQRGRVIERKDDPNDRDPKPGDGWKDRHPAPFPERNKMRRLSEDDSDPSADELIMVMMPRTTWDAFQDLAVKNGGSPAQAISTALKLLEKALKGDEEDVG